MGISSIRMASVSYTHLDVYKRQTMGQFKTRVMKDKIADICPGTQVITFEEFVLPDNIESLFERMKHQMGQGSSVDYILDAIEDVYKRQQVHHVQEYPGMAFTPSSLSLHIL